MLIREIPPKLEYPSEIVKTWDVEISGKIPNSQLLIFILLYNNNEKIFQIG